MSNKHVCHALCCKTQVPPRMLMCLRHWRKVPKNLQQEIWKQYRPGQEIDKKPTLRYIATALSAIFAVADNEKINYDAHAIIRETGLKIASSLTTEQLQKLIKRSHPESEEQTEAEKHGHWETEL